MEQGKAKERGLEGYWVTQNVRKETVTGGATQKNGESSAIRRVLLNPQRSPSTNKQTHCSKGKWIYSGNADKKPLSTINLAKA